MLGSAISGLLTGITGIEGLPGFDLRIEQLDSPDAVLGHRFGDDLGGYHVVDQHLPLVFAAGPPHPRSNDHAPPVPLTLK